MIPKITAIDRTVVHLPFKERCAPWNAVWIGQWCVLEVLRIRTEDPDVFGWGESVPSYTGVPTNENALQSLIGENPAEHLWNPDLGTGLQMALFDVVGHALDVPVHRMMNLPQVRESCPVSWWTIDVPPPILAAEAQDAVAAGYLAHKFKARPWYDIREQVDAVAKVTPEAYSLDIDFNRSLLNYPTAVEVLTDLDREPRCGIYEAPIAAGAFDDYRRLRGRVQRPIAEHFDQGPFAPGALAAAYEGYVFSPNTAGNGVGGLLRQGLVAAEFGKSGWIQMVGAGLTTAFALHIASVLPAARWPILTASNLYAEDLLCTPIPVAGGYSPVPSGRGLGVEIDTEALSRLEMPAPYRIEYPRHVLTFELPEGRRRHYASSTDLFDDCRIYGNVPLAERGANLTVTPDDGSNEFESIFRRATTGPYWSGL